MANDPYFRNDPGTGLQRITVYNFDLDNNFSTWKSWRTNDGRVLPNGASSFDLIENPFGQGSLIKLATFFDPAVAGKSFGGFGMRASVTPALVLNNQTYIEFELYYPVSAVSKFMRFEVWSTSSGGEGFQGNAGYPGKNKTQIYIRISDIEKITNSNDFIGFFKGEAWYKKNITAVTPLSIGKWEYLNIDLHTETGTKVNGELLLIGNIRITQTDPNSKIIPNIENEKEFSEVPPIKSRYNSKTECFLTGVSGTGKVEPDSIRGCHYEIFTDQNNLKPEIHERPPQWLRDEYPDYIFKPAERGCEWIMPTDDYLSIRDSGKRGEYKMHYHCLSWVNQSPFWMRQIIPENITSMQWNADGRYYIGGTNSIGPYKKVNKNIARRVYFNHILYALRHFMSVDPKYGSDEKRGIIPFHSVDVVNVELHESWHRVIDDKPDEWDTALRHVSWLMAMTDDDLGNIRQHYVYLLFKYAHIAVPNALMAAKFKAGYKDTDIVPEYMKLDNHDDEGSIDAYITDKPPILVINDYDITNISKSKVAYNMIKAVNTAWETDPLYDGRNLIECMGIQGHEMVNRATTSQYKRAIEMFAGLIDEGRLDSICFSEFDIRQPDFAPGGEALAPAVLNQKQADVIGYQYALFFKLFEKYKKYIDHVIIWSEFGASWMSSYVPFDHNRMASQAYYGLMDPDRFIQGHSYLDDFFIDEYSKLKDDYL